MPTRIEKSIHAYFLEHDAFFQTKLDSCFKWLPYAAPFTAHLFGIKAKNTWLKQLLLAGATEGIRYLITDNIKNFSTEKRPSPSVGNRSFPSGHTSSSFSGAYFMQQELKYAMPVLSYGGYAAAVSTGVMRLMKSRHWLKDVIAGAAIGVLSAKLAYVAINRLYRDKRKSDKLHNSITLSDTSPDLPQHHAPGN